MQPTEPALISQNSGFWRRAGAFLVDGIVAAIVATALSAAFGYKDEGTIVSSIFMALYSTAFIAYAQSTPGKMLFGIKVFGSNGEKLTLWRAFVRESLKMIFTPIAIASALMVIFSKQKQAMHDHIARSVVVKG